MTLWYSSHMRHYSTVLIWQSTATEADSNNDTAALKWYPCGTYIATLRHRYQSLKHQYQDPTCGTALQQLYYTHQIPTSPCWPYWSCHDPSILIMTEWYPHDVPTTLQNSQSTDIVNSWNCCHDPTASIWDSYGTRITNSWVLEHILAPHNNSMRYPFYHPRSYHTQKKNPRSYHDPMAPPYGTHLMSPWKISVSTALKHSTVQ